MDDKSSQQDEVLALKSIYEDEFSFDEKTNKGSFFVKIESAESKFFNLNFVQEKVNLKIQHLPPIQIEFELKENYPSQCAPSFQLSCRWLSVSKLNKLCKKFDKIWEDSSNTSILFSWISFLSDDLFEYLKLNTEDLKLYEEKKPTNEIDATIDQRAIKLPCSSHLIRNYDKDQVELKFKNSYFVCNVCFTDKQGNECMKFNQCEHVFCNECMKGYFESQITSGNINSLNCPQDKCDSQALQNQVLNLVGIDLFNRYDSLLLKDSLNNMSDIVYCPRVNCQSPVIPEDTLAQCNSPNCNYVFCALCRQGYHGIEPCKITNTQLKEICLSYKSGDKTVREQLIKKYGEKRIKSAIEEHSSMELIENTSKQCPSCHSWMQKLDGCNKMTCVKCHCYFCWLCKKILSKSDPYSHFNSANSECFDKLFEGVINHQENENNDDDDMNLNDDDFFPDDFETDNDNDDEDDDEDDDDIEFR